MNKAVTEGLVLMPPPFSAGLGVWSSGDGVPGSPTYDGAVNAAFVPSDPDFGGCLELLKTSATQKLRWMGQTPILPGCYLRVTARIKAVSGALPTVSIAGFPATSANALVAGRPTTGPGVSLTTYGEVVEVSAIIGTSNRGGVNLVWPGVNHGFLGLDLTGPNGGVVRVDDLIIEDVTAFWLRDMMDWVDVRDYGAVGNGATNDRDAFVAAAAAALASGSGLLVSAGTYHIASTLTIEVPVRFQGTLSMPDAARLQLTKSYDFPTYAQAFGSEETGLRKGLQALFHFTDHDTFDLKGRRVLVHNPIDLSALTGIDFHSIRRVLRNGLIEAGDSEAWATVTVTSSASYSAGTPTTLTSVVNVANIPVGARVTGAGVGREIYVTARNIGAQTLTLSQPLFGAPGVQTYTFDRYQYILDMSGFGRLDRFEIDSVEFQCRNISSAVSLSTQGQINSIRNCTFNRPKNKAITSISRGCQGMLIDQCIFLSSESELLAQNRVSVALNVNANDIKLRDNVFQHFGHGGVIAGTYHLIHGNHIYQGDTSANGVRKPGFILTGLNPVTTITGNYIDNCSIEVTNEYDATPNWSGEYSFGGLNIVGNVFLVSNVIPSFRFIVLKPHGSGHHVVGLVVTGNTFRAANATPARVEAVDTAFGSLDYLRFRNVIWDNNSYFGFGTQTESPLVLRHQQTTAAANWTIQTGDKLPFGGYARTVSSVVMEGQANGPGNEVRTAMPYTMIQQGPAFNQARLVWPSPTRGRAVVTIRVDNPL